MSTVPLYAANSQNFHDHCQPSSAAEAGLSVLEWYIHHIEHALDEFGTYNIVEVFDQAKQANIPIEILKTFRDLREHLSNATELAQELIEQLTALNVRVERQKSRNSSAQSRDSAKART